MIHNTEFFEMIEDYCLNLLSEELKSDFETELKQNPELRKELEPLSHGRTVDVFYNDDVYIFARKSEKITPLRAEGVN